ncbi:ferredoxin family protein [Thermanaerosceptrum fracticalcis]|uniref:Ferredoxin family protein n=1 Tax=Thermanaerosceptrum fracticalcis TaxID=1712410 RepID=A0A7G6E6E6_THEFR|nr:ferredoxin family protein [Thermanaerosceptrum fracticalcis]QNB47650.1 ferredoxin family protein [Thermanaerosceptrum fracticalcis]
MKKLSIEERLGFNKFNVDDDEAHITINKEICRTCTEKPCLYACPALLYNLNEAGEMTFDYAGCLECGTCRVVCQKQGAIQWNYPRGIFGVQFRYG